MAEAERPATVQIAIQSLSRVGAIAAIVATVVGIVGGLVLYYAGQSVLVAMLIGVVAVLLIIAAFLAFYGSGVTDRLQGALRESGALSSQNASLQRDLGARDGAIQALTADKNALSQQLETQTAELERAKAAVQQVTQNLQQTQQQLQSHAARLQQAEVALQEEQVSSARAPFMPELDVTLQTTGFGILTPKTVLIRLTNVGSGNAVRVNVSVALNRPNAHGPLQARDFVQVIPPGHSRDIRIVNMRELAGFASIRGVVNYDSQFGPRHAVDMVWNFA